MSDNRKYVWLSSLGDNCKNKKNCECHKDNKICDKNENFKKCEHHKDNKICDKDENECFITINNILVCSDKHKKFTDEYEIDKDTIRNLRDNKEYKCDKKGVTIVNKFNCGECCDSDDDDD